MIVAKDWQQLPVKNLQKGIQLYDLNLRFRFILIKQKKSYHKRQVNTEHSDILKHVLKRDENKAVNALIGHYKITDKYFDK